VINIIPHINTKFVILAQLLSKQDLSQIVKDLKGTGTYVGEPKKILRRAYKYGITNEDLNHLRSVIDK